MYLVDNAPIPYEYKKMPEGWKTQLDSQVFSQSWHLTIRYNTPKYNGVIVWEGDRIYGELPGCFDWNGECLQASDGHDLYKYLNIPEDYCIRTGKDGWMKFLSRPYFEMWLQKE